MAGPSGTEEWLPTCGAGAELYYNDPITRTWQPVCGSKAPIYGKVNGEWVPLCCGGYSPPKPPTCAPKGPFTLIPSATFTYGGKTYSHGTFSTYVPTADGNIVLYAVGSDGSPNTFRFARVIHDVTSHTNTTTHGHVMSELEIGGTRAFAHERWVLGTDHKNAVAYEVAGPTDIYIFDSYTGATTGLIHGLWPGSNATDYNRHYTVTHAGAWNSPDRQFYWVHVGWINGRWYSGSDGSEISSTMYVFDVTNGPSSAPTHVWDLTGLGGYYLDPQGYGTHIAYPLTGWSLSLSPDGNYVMVAGTAPSEDPHGEKTVTYLLSPSGGITKISEWPFDLITENAGQQVWQFNTPGPTPQLAYGGGNGAIVAPGYGNVARSNLAAVDEYGQLGTVIENAYPIDGPTVRGGYTWWLWRVVNPPNYRTSTYKLSRISPAGTVTDFPLPQGSPRTYIEMVWLSGNRLMVTYTDADNNPYHFPVNYYLFDCLVPLASTGWTDWITPEPVDMRPNALSPYNNVDLPTYTRASIASSTDWSTSISRAMNGDYGWVDTSGGLGNYVDHAEPGRWQFTEFDYSANGVYGGNNAYAYTLLATSYEARPNIGGYTVNNYGDGGYTEYVRQRTGPQSVVDHYYELTELMKSRLTQVYVPDGYHVAEWQYERPVVVPPHPAHTSHAGTMWDNPNTFCGFEVLDAEMALFAYTVTANPADRISSQFSFDYRIYDPHSYIDTSYEHKHGSVIGSMTMSPTSPDFQQEIVDVKSAVAQWFPPYSIPADIGLDAWEVGWQLSQPFPVITGDPGVMTSWCARAEVSSIGLRVQHGRVRMRLVKNA